MRESMLLTGPSRTSSTSIVSLSIPIRVCFKTPSIQRLKEPSFVPAEVAALVSMATS